MRRNLLTDPEKPRPAVAKVGVKGLWWMGLSFLFLMLLSNFSNAQLLQWNTYGNLGTETTEPSVYNDPNISASSLTQGSITAAANGNRFGGSNWWNTGNTVAGNTLAEAIAGNDYIQFIVTPNAGYSFTPTSFVFQWDKSGTGPKNLTLRSSVDGFSTDLGSVVPAAALGTSNTITISGLTAITTATTFRIYGYGATATAGTGGFDVSTNVVNVQLNGTTASVGCSISLSSAAGTDAQTLCLGSSISNITYSTAVATGASFAGLPAGVSGSWASNVATISGTPSAAGTYNYTVTLTGGGCSNTANGSITVNASPADPTGTITPAANPACGSTTLTYSGASANIYWQTSATGTSTTYPTTSAYTVSSSGTYYVRAYNGTCWSTNSLASAAITISAAPSITTQPSNQTVVEPNSATFSVVASNATGYQWQLSTDNGSTWADISGATAASYTVTTTALAMSGYQYRCVVSASPCGSVTSNAATLTVTTGPCLSESAFTALPAGWAATSVTYASGEAVFGSNTGELATLALSNPTSLTFDLRRTTNTSAKTLYVEISTTTQGGTYTTVATYDHSNTTSGGTTACTVDLSAYTSFSPVFIKFRKESSTTSPWYLDNVNVYCSSFPTISVGSITNFGSICVGATSVEKSYTVSGANLSNDIVITPPANFEISTTSGSGFVANPSSITLTQIGGVVSPTTIYVVFKPTAAASYSGNITHTCTGATSKNVAVAGTGVSGSTITSQPGNTSTTDGGNATFTVVATVAASYQWQISTNGGGTWSNLSNGGIYSNVTTATLSLTGVTLAMTGYQYRCVITSSCSGSVTSNAGTLTVMSGPVWLIDEDFDATTTVASLATTTDGPFTATAGLFTTPSATVASRGVNALFLEADGILTTPVFANGDLLCFWMGMAGGTSGNGIQLDVEVTTDGSTWTTLATYTAIPVQTRFYFCPIASNVIQARFVYAEGTNNNLYLDDVMVRSAGFCTATPLIEKVLVNSCAETDEGVNEFVLVDVDQAINVDDLVITFPSADPGTLSFCTDCDKTFTTNSAYTQEMNDTAGCTIVYDVVPGGVIPANSKLIIFTGALPEFTYDLSDACGGAPYYVLYCNNANISGRFANSPGGTVYKYRYVSIIDQASGCYDHVFYDENIPNVDGEYAEYDLVTRAMTYGNNGCTEAIVPLPVELLYFTSVCSDKKVQLLWATASETNNAYFTIEAQNEFGEFVPVATVNGAGNSNEKLEYSTSVESSSKYFRLKQTDFDGKFSYSKVIAVGCENSNLVVFPTVASEGETINVFGDNVNSIRVFDGTGREISPDIIDNKVCGLEQGIYFFVINNKWNYKIVVQ